MNFIPVFAERIDNVPVGRIEQAKDEQQRQRNHHGDVFRADRRDRCDAVPVAVVIRPGIGNIRQAHPDQPDHIERQRDLRRDFARREVRRVRRLRSGTAIPLDPAALELAEHSARSSRSGHTRFLEFPRFYSNIKNDFVN